MATSHRTLTGSWSEVATGEGFATITAWAGDGAEWVIASPGTNPPLGQGHWIASCDTHHLHLAAGESLYVRGRDLIAITADNEVL